MTINQPEKCSLCRRTDSMPHLNCKMPDCPGPVVTAEVEGAPITEALYTLFAPWGIVAGIVLDERGIHVGFEGGYQLLFMPHYVGGKL